MVSIFDCKAHGKRRRTLQAGSTIVLQSGLLMAVLVAPLSKFSFADDAALRARLETEAPKSWSEFKSISKHLDVVLTQRHLRPDSEMVMRITVKSSDANMLHTLAYLKVPEAQRARLQGSERVMCQNSQGSFKLEKRQENLPWFVKYLGDKGGVEKELKHVDMALLFPLLVFDRYLIDWFRHPAFLVKDVEWVDRPTGKLVAVTFSCAKSEDYKYWIHDGVLYLNPDRMWAIQECVCDATTKKGEEHVTQRTEFRADCGKLPLLKASSITAQTTAGEVQIITNFDRFERREIPETEFALTAFGLPGLRRPSIWRSAWLWFALTGFGVVCVLAAIWLRRRALT